MNKRPIAVIAIFFIVGIVVAKFLPDSVKFLHILVVSLIFIFCAFLLNLSHLVGGQRWNDHLRGVFLVLSIISFAVLLYVNSNIFSNNHISHFLKEKKLNASIVGIIKSPALIRKPYYGKIASTYLFEIEGIKNNDEWLEVKGLSQIRIQTEKDYGYGDRLMIRGVIKRPATAVIASEAKQSQKKEIASSLSAPRNDNRSFDYRQYLQRQKIFAIISTKENNITFLSSNYKSNPILKYIYFIRERCKQHILEKMPLENGAFLRAILLGDRSELSKRIKASFKHSGTMHILAISGLHIAFITLIILYLLRLIRIPRIPSYIFTIFFLIGFAFLALSRPSVVRAVVMACVFLIGMILSRRTDIYNSLGIAALFILIKNPKDLFNIGFQLSFLAVLSILYMAPKFMRFVREDVNFYVKRWFYIPLVVSISAFIGTFPLILYYFKIITPISIISNLFVIPILFILLAAALSFLALGWLPFLGVILILFNNLLIQAIFSLADFFSSLRFGHFYLG